MAQNSHKGLVLVFTGDGKGKTTAALGQVMRAAGHGLKTAIVFFMKGDYTYGEFSALRRFGIEFKVFGLPDLADPAHLKPEEIKQAKLALDSARQLIESAKYDMVVLDEVNVAAAMGLIDIEDVIHVINSKPPGMNLVLTGRYADRRLVEIAGLVTEMKAVKHPYDQGILARKGIEF